MAISLDPVTEQRIQRELARGRFTSPDEVVSQALDLLETEPDWFADDRLSVHTHIEESFAAAARGETYTPEQVRTILAQRRTRQ